MIEINTCYKTINGTIIMVNSVSDKAWGIYGEFITSEYRGLINTWCDETYPYKMSFDAAEAGLALTDEIVSKEQHPEYYL